VRKSRATIRGVVNPGFVFAGAPGQLRYRPQGSRFPDSSFYSKARDKTSAITRPVFDPAAVFAAFGSQFAAHLFRGAAYQSRA